MEPRKASPLSWVLIFFLTISLWGVKVSSEEHHHHGKSKEGPVVERDQRRTLLVTEFGEITAIDIKEGQKELPYHLQFITLEPNSLFLPVLLQADMVFYVHTGSGKLTWANDDGTSTIRLREGDVCSLNEGSVFYIQSNLEAERRKLRIYAMFTNTDDNTYDPSIGAYSRINELVKGFDKKIMQAALKVPEDLIEAIINKTETPAIVHAVPEKRNIVQELEASFLKNFLGVGSNSKKLETYNIFEHDPDFKNPIGWSTAVTKKQLKSLKRTNIGFLMVNLNMGSILGPHWNAKATELTVGVDGEGMVRVVCGSGNENETECQNMRFKVKEGDAFLVPRFHPMAQMSFNNGPFVFLGFSTSAKKNHPQFLAGKGSVLHILDKKILARSLGVSNRTIDELLRSPEDSIIFRCKEAQREQEQAKREAAQREQERAKREQERRRREEVAGKGEEEEEHAGRGHERRKEEEETARREQEQEQAERQQQKREKRRQKEEQGEGEEEEEEDEEEPTWWERRERRKQKGKSPEEGVEWEQEEARTASREGEKKTPRE
ncbi:Vicilin-like seed storage protein [Glycine max]|nr:Vicilin-like seed storage protein [Glycine max]